MWPNVCRQGQFSSAIEYVRANRIRRVLMGRMKEAPARIDLYVCPTRGGENLLLTNLTGHPASVFPSGFRSSDGTQTSITFNGRLHCESELLALVHAYQQTTDSHLQRPPLPSEGEA